MEMSLTTEDLRKFVHMERLFLFGIEQNPELLRCGKLFIGVDLASMKKIREKRRSKAR
jgi:hypothetical protein